MLDGQQARWHGGAVLRLESFRATKPVPDVSGRLDVTPMRAGKQAGFNRGLTLMPCF
ncbi:MAG: hypothetical protein FWD51_04635 [Betaproteobacteria bacterium]|nr:hypothetical protein [Betaproteobacteria bacterium]